MAIQTLRAVVGPPREHTIPSDGPEVVRPFSATEATSLPQFLERASAGPRMARYGVPRQRSKRMAQAAKSNAAYCSPSAI